jgi:hypothetical protein
MTSELTAAGRRFLQLVYDEFKQAGAWPLVDPLQWRLERDRDLFDLAEASASLDPALVRLGRGQEQKAELTLDGLLLCDGAKDDLDAFVRFVALCYATYRDSDSPDPEITYDAVRQALNLDRLAVTRLLHIAAREPSITGGGSGSIDSDLWQRAISPEIRYFRDVATVEDYRAAQERRRRIQLEQHARYPAPSFGIGDFGQVTEWLSIEQRIAEMKARLEVSVSADDFQDIGRRAREILIDAADLLFRERMLPSETAVPGKKDAKRRLQYYVDFRFGDALGNEVLRTSRAAIDLANAATHRTTVRRVGAFVAAQATVAVVRVLQATDSEPDSLSEE